MFKILIILFLFLPAFTGCKLENITEPFNYERDVPIWLKAKIDSISTDPFYVGTQVYRNECNGIYIYYFAIPVSSCAYCEVYDPNGKKLLLQMTCVKIV